MGQDRRSTPGQRSGFLGTLKDALAAASRDETGRPDSAKTVAEAPQPIQLPPPVPQRKEVAEEDLDMEVQLDEAQPDCIPEPPAKPGLSAADAAREARGGMAAAPVTSNAEQVLETTRVSKAMIAKEEEAERTKLVRGKVEVSRGQFSCDPVVGWLVVVGGPGIGSFRPIFEGNNTIGRSLTQRIPIDFGDDAISSEEQAYIRYDSSERSFLFVPNLSKTNVVSVNSSRPTGAVELAAMDVIIMGRTQLVFVPFCGRDFDWSEIAES
jgi:hypothetical protein